MNMELSQGGRGTCVQCYKLKIFYCFQETFSSPADRMCGMGYTCIECHTYVSACLDIYNFLSSCGRPLTKSRFVEAVRSALATAGLNPKDYAGHSFRIGAATTAHSRGLNDSTIQTLGRWSSTAYLVYIMQYSFAFVLCKLGSYIITGSMRHGRWLLAGITTAILGAQFN